MTEQSRTIEYMEQKRKRRKRKKNKQGYWFPKLKKVVIIFYLKSEKLYNFTFSPSVAAGIFKQSSQGIRSLFPPL